MTPTAMRDQIVAFRLRGHGLAAPPEPYGLLRAAGRCGVQNSPPGSAILALHARSGGVTREAFTRLIAEDRSLLQTWSLRGSPLIFPTRDAALFTAGVLPAEEAAAGRLIPGVLPALGQLELGLFEVTDAAAEVLPAVLAGRQLDIHELGAEIAERMEPRLSPSQLRQWRSEGPYARGQALGEAVVHFCVRILTLRGELCIAPRTEARARFVLTTEFLGGPLPPRDLADTRAELLRRYLRCTGPASRADFAEWIGVGARDVSPWWDPVRPELAAIQTAAGERWLLAEDLPALRAAVIPSGARVLPPGDPYLRQPERETIVPRAHHGAVWRTVGAPGVVLLDGEIVATWRPRKQGSRLTVTVEPLAALTPQNRSRISEAIEPIGPLRGAADTEVRFGEE